MAKVTLDRNIKTMWGRIGNFVFRRSPTGETYLSATPDMSRVEWSPAQKAHRQRFKQAVVYARAAMADTEVRAHYVKEAADQGKRPFDLAVSDYFKDRNLLTSGSLNAWVEAPNE